MKKIRIALLGLTFGYALTFYTHSAYGLGYGGSEHNLVNPIGWLAKEISYFVMEPVDLGDVIPRYLLLVPGIGALIWSTIFFGASYLLGPSSGTKHGSPTVT